MSRRQIVFFVVLPFLTAAGYFTFWLLMPAAFERIVLSEQGLTEVATAVLFVIAACVACDLYLKTGRVVPTPYRVLFLLFAGAGLFVALEEVSYGQHFFGFATPEFFDDRNVQGEVNLHNLFSTKPSKRMHRVADLGSMIGFVLLPSVLLLGRAGGEQRPVIGQGESRFAGWLRALRAQAYRPGHWTYYLLPRFELVALVALTRLVAWGKKVPGFGVEHNELREFYWAWAAVAYIIVMRSRFLPRR